MNDDTYTGWAKKLHNFFIASSLTDLDLVIALSLLPP